MPTPLSSALPADERQSAAEPIFSKRPHTHVRRKVSIVSLHFSAAHISLLIGYGKAFTLLGCDVRYILHPAYTSFAEFQRNNSVRASTHPGWDNAHGFTHAVFLNSSPGNHRHAGRLRKSGCHVWYVYHEPWDSLGTYCRQESLQSLLKLSVAHYLSVKMLKASTGAILPSQRCVEAYHAGDRRYNPSFRNIPLLFDDESLGLPAEERTYFSYIGNITRAHNFDEFIEFIRFSLTHGHPTQFLVASRQPFPSHILKDALIARHLGQLTIRCGQPLTNAEINALYARSLCVWNLYRRSTQSGVLAKAMMFGTPVLASRVGSFPEFVQDGSEGRLLAGTSPDEVWAAYQQIRDNFSHYSRHCRIRFIDSFYYKSNLHLLESL